MHLQRNRAIWAAVGAAPLTRKCLESNKVRHTTDGDPQHVNLNHNACNLLSTIGSMRRPLEGGVENTDTAASDSSS